MITHIAVDGMKFMRKFFQSLGETVKKVAISWGTVFMYPSLMVSKAGAWWANFTF